MQTEIGKIKDPVERLFAFIQERYAIQQRRFVEKLPPPWTTDPVLRDYRFCSIYREDDKVTTWIRENWREPHSDDEDLWFAMCVARIFNTPETLEAMGYPVPFDRHDKIAKKLVRWRDKGNKLFNGAYIIGTGGLSISKVAYVWWDILVPLWKARERLRPREGDTLNSFHMLLGQMQGFGSFLTAQVIADVKYHGVLRRAEDWHTFAASGPGSRRGLNAALGRPLKSHWHEDEWRLELGRLREKLLPMFRRAQMPEPHAQDVQNCLCEFFKFERARLTGQMPKQKFDSGNVSDNLRRGNHEREI